MVWVLLLAVAVLVVVATGALMTGRLVPDPPPPPVASTPDSGLPEPPVAADIDDVRFDTALRGYRMDQVDAVLDRLQDRLAELEARAAQEPDPR